MTIHVLDQSSEGFSQSVYRTAQWTEASIQTFEVHTSRDPSGVWMANSANIPGLNLEADTLAELVAEIEEWAPELLIDNQVVKEGERFAIVVHRAGTNTRFYH